MANDKREQTMELNRDGLTGYYEQMAEDDGTIKTTVEWLVDMSLLIQDDVGKRLKAKWSPCCPSCNFKRIENDSSHFVTFSEEYCGNRECDCHGAGYAAATAEAQADGWVAIETVDDLPKEAGRYLWQFRNVDDGIVFDLRIFTPSFTRQHFVKAFVAWKRPAPYQRKSEGDSNER